jgi:hypothetical protein
VGLSLRGEKTISETRVLPFQAADSMLQAGLQRTFTPLELQKLYLQTRSASGTRYMGYLIELMMDFFESWLSHGKMDLKFVPFDVGQIGIESSGHVEESEDSKARFSLESGVRTSMATKWPSELAVSLI